MVNNWIDVLGVYAVMMTMDERSATDVVTVTPDKVDALRKVFWTMNEVEYEVESGDHADGSRCGRGRGCAY